MSKSDEVGVYPKAGLPPKAKPIIWIRVCTPCVKLNHEECGGDCQCPNSVCQERNRAEGQLGTSPAPPKANR